MKKYSFTLLDKFLFYCSYFWYKLILPLETKSPKLKLWFYEWHYSLTKFINYESSIAWPYPINQIDTTFGRFRIRLNTSDAANVSPAFERSDLNYLQNLLNRLVMQKKKVLFCDIGGDLGSYTVFVGNLFKGKNVAIGCFEPVESSCRLIEENLALNDLKDGITVYNFGLLDKYDNKCEILMNNDTPGSSSITNGSAKNCTTMVIKTRKLDDVMKDKLDLFDAIVMKIDVEGVEQKVLEGALALCTSGKEIHCMVEDFIEPSIITWMQNHGWEFCSKVTTYNSWWKR